MKTLYKVIAIILVLAIIPVAFFVPFVKIIATSKAMSVLSGSEVLLDKTYSLYDMYESFFRKDSEREPLNIKAVLEGIPDSTKKALGPSFVAFLVFFVLLLLMAIAIIILIIARKKKGLIIILSGVGLIFTLLMNVFFNRFASPLISGVVPVTDLLTSDVLSHFMGGGLAAIGGLVGSLLGNIKIVEIRILSLSTAYVLMLASYIASLVWSLAHTLIEWK